MATSRPKEKSTVGKEKVLPTNSQSTSTNTTRPSTPSDKPASSENTTRPSTPDKPASSSNTTRPSTPSSEKEKHIPNYLKPTKSSRNESHSSKNTKTDSSQRTATNRRRSLDKPSSSSNLTKQNQSSSRVLKALVSPGPRERSGAQHQSLSLSSKSASEKTSRTSRDGALSTNTKSVNKSMKRPSPTPKKVARDGPTANSTRAPKSDAVTKEELKNVENEPEVEDASNGKVKVVVEDDNKQDSENETDQINPQIVESENEHENKKEQEQAQVVEGPKPGEPQIKADNDNINDAIPTASEEEEARAVSVAEEIKLIFEVDETKKEDPPEDKAKDVHQQGENKSTDDSTDYPEPEEQKVEVKEKEEGNHNRVTNKMESENNELGKAKMEMEIVEGETIEGVKEGEDNDDNGEKGEVKEKAKSTPEQEGAREQGKKETSQVSNDVIEETASKLEKRTNKVRALAGAFQTVIDHQSK